MKNSTIEAFFEKWTESTMDWIKAMRAEYKELGGMEFKNKYKFAGISQNSMKMIAPGYRLEGGQGATTVRDMITKDMEAKKEKIYGKIADAAGEIEEISLHDGEDGTPNGYVKGNKATVTITTIAAGGMVQCAHYRVLVKVKKK